MEASWSCSDIGDCCCCPIYGHRTSSECPWVIYIIELVHLISDRSWDLPSRYSTSCGNLSITVWIFMDTREWEWQGTYISHKFCVSGWNSSTSQQDSALLGEFWRDQRVQGLLEEDLALYCPLAKRAESQTPLIEFVQKTVWTSTQFFAFLTKCTFRSWTSKSFPIIWISNLD